MILVTGVTGTMGRAVLEELLAQGLGPVRALIRNGKDSTRLPAGVDVATGDFADPASLRKALAGVDAAYLVCAPIPQLVQLETDFLKVAREAQVAHVVIQSALGAADFPKSFPSWHRKVELEAAALQVPSTVLRPNGFMQNVLAYFAGSIATQNAFYDGLGDARLSHIDVRDVAAAVVNCFRSSATIGQIYELSGPEALTNTQLAERITREAGRQIQYVPLTLEQMKAGMMSAGMPEDRAKPVVELYEYYLAGKGDAPDLQLRQLLQREPRRIDAFLTENAAAFAKK